MGKRAVDTILSSLLKVCGADIVTFELTEEGYNVDFRPNLHRSNSLVGRESFRVPLNSVLSIIVTNSHYCVNTKCSFIGGV